MFRFHGFGLLALVALTACGTRAPSVFEGQKNVEIFATASPSPTPSTVTETENALIPDPLPAAEGAFRNTFYYVVFEKDYSTTEPKDTKILDRAGNVLARVTKKFATDLLMEGSGKLIDGRMLNYAGRVNGQSRFHVTRHPFGRGAGNCPLVPFKTIAVDPNQIALGSIVFIDESVGMLLPDGTRHNGVWYAQDTGGAILHDRIDIFIGAKKDSGTLSRQGITHLEGLTVRILKRPDAENCAYQSPE